MVLIENVDITKYITSEEYDYLINLFGDDDHLISVLSHQSNTRNACLDLASDIDSLKIFHKIYLGVKNNSDINNSELIKCLLLFDIAYDNIKRQFDNIEDKKIKSIILPREEVLLKLQNRINEMKLINDKDYYIYSDLARQISIEKDYFSLNKEFSYDAFKYSQGLNAVTVITPSQTISRFNDDSVNGLVGSGHHDANFSQIIKTIYGKDFFNAITGQDIKIRYVSYIVGKSELQFLMTLEIPLFVNSTQKQALINLNDEIINFEKKNNKDIIIHGMITDYVNKDYHKNISSKNNLDEIIKNLVINDNIEYKYPEKYFIGYSNVENHYNRQSKSK